MAEDDACRDASKVVELASDRTVLASERTYASWIRTGCAALIAGLAVMRFMADVLTSWETKVISGILLLFSVVCFVIAAWRQRQLQKWFPRAEIPHLSFLVCAVSSVILSAASLLALVAMLQMKDPNAASTDAGSTSPDKAVPLSQASQETDDPSREVTEREVSPGRSNNE